MKRAILLLLAACGDSDKPSTPAIDAGPVQGELSDDFAGDTLDPAWERFKTELADVEVAGGELHLVPTEYCVWFHADSGPGLFKRVAGDFKATSSVRVRRVSDPELPPGPEFQFGGLIARDPGSSAENWLFAVVGERGGYLALESKTTVNGESAINAPDWGSGDAELRLCRVGARFLLLARHPGGAWETQGDHQRPDLPATLQVGPIAYTYTSSPDLRASFDRVEIQAISDISACTAD